MIGAVTRSYDGERLLRLVSVVVVCPVGGVGDGDVVDIVVMFTDGESGAAAVVAAVAAAVVAWIHRRRRLIVILSPLPPSDLRSSGQTATVNTPQWTRLERLPLARYGLTKLFDSCFFVFWNCIAVWSKNRAIFIYLFFHKSDLTLTYSPYSGLNDLLLDHICGIATKVINSQ